MPKWCAEGLTSVGDVYLKGVSLPTFYLGLYKNTAEPAADGEMTDITEAAAPGEDGYARIALDPGGWAESPAGVWTHAAQAFLADGGDWGLITGFFVTTAETGTAGDLVCVKHFPQGPYQISDGAGMAFVPIVTNVTEFSPSASYVGNIQVVLIPAADYSFPALGDHDWLLVDYADRLYPWETYCGIPGGIPNRTTIYTSLGVPGQVPSYAQSVTATQIAAAIAACTSGQAVFLNQGTYNIGVWSWNRKNGVTLRGAGPGKTILRPNTGGSFIESGYPMFVSPGIAISSGYTKGSTAIVLASTPTTYYRAGNNIMLCETTDKNKWGTNIGVYVGSECTAETSVVGVTNSKFTYFTRIMSIVGNTINLASPIPVSFKAGNNPTAYAPDSTAVPASMCGLENMTLDGAATGSSYAAINYRFADRMWLKDVELKNWSGGDNGIIANYATFQCEYRRLYMHDCQGFPTQDDGQGIGLEWSPSNTLIVDCIAHNMASLYQGVGENATAVLYNYCRTMARGPIVVPMGWLNGGISHHGPESIMGLYEGNVFNSWAFDGYHGSGAFATLHRNNINGLTPGYTTETERKMIHLLRGSYYCNVIGNILGDPSWTMTQYDAGPVSGENCAFVLGYPNASGISLTPHVSWPTFTNTYPDPNVAATLLRHGNYDYYHHAAVWDGGIASHSIPASLFYDSKPSWFGSLDWPPIGPDVGGYLSDIPAQRRWKTYAVSGNLDDLFTDVS